VRLTRSNPSTRHHDNVNSLPDPPPTAALQSQKCLRQNHPGVHLHRHHRWRARRVAQHQSPSLPPKQQRPYMEADFEGLDPEVSPTRRQLHDWKLKLGVQFRRLSWEPPQYARSQRWFNKCCKATAGPVPPGMTVLRQMWPVLLIKRRRIHLTRGGSRARTSGPHPETSTKEQPGPVRLRRTPMSTNPSGHNPGQGVNKSQEPIRS
jgi:hypothetical protein